jgi:hypothetical protein
MDTQMWIIVVILLVAIIIGLAAYIYFQKTRTQKLQRRFGPEYDRTVSRHGSQSEAEAELRAREERVKKLHIVPLSPTDAARFSAAWRDVQNRFVDDPRAAVEEADRQVRELMAKRGYPMGDFEQRASDISVDHASVVDHYRHAHDIALRSQPGAADTEALRKAIVHYRSLFDELLETQETERNIREPEHRKGGLRYGV